MTPCAGFLCAMLNVHLMPGCAQAIDVISIKLMSVHMQNVGRVRCEKQACLKAVCEQAEV